MTSETLLGLDILSSDGVKIGEVEGFTVDTQKWSILSLDIKAVRAVLERLDLKKPLMGTSKLSIPVDWINGVEDSVVLKFPVEGIRFADE